MSEERHMCKCLVLLMFCVILQGFRVAVVGDDGTDFLDAKELGVEKIINQSIINTGQRCESLATCDNPTNCSHDACSMEDTGDFQCMVVKNNKFCSLSGTTNTSCNNMNLDYGQKPLESLFKTLSDSSNLSRAYFAAIDGNYRVYPGMPLIADDCRKFDSRIRPWFRTSTFVVKTLVILIDLGASMGNNLPPDLGAGTIFGAAKNMFQQLLNTLSAQEYVNIIVYDSARVIQLYPKAVLVQDYNGTESTELDSLRRELDKQIVEGQNRQSNLSAAILEAMPNFGSNSQTVKAIIVITDGVFASLGNATLPITELSTSSVKLFLFKLKQPNDRDIFLTNNTLIQHLCTVGGHFEPIPKKLENPPISLPKVLLILGQPEEDPNKWKTSI